MNPSELAPRVWYEAPEIQGFLLLDVFSGCKEEGVPDAELAASDWPVGMSAGAFSQLLTDIRGPRLFWVMPSLGREDEKEG